MEPTQTEAASPSTLLGDFRKLIEQFKLPGIDVDALLEARRKDIDALAEANQTALAGFQSLTQKQADILKTTLDELQGLVKQTKSSGSADDASAKEVVQQGLKKAFANMRELAEVAYTSQSDAFAVVGRRVEENIQEVKSLLRPKK